MINEGSRPESLADYGFGSLRQLVRHFRAELARAREEIDTVTADMDALRVVAEERAAQVEQLRAGEALDAALREYIGSLDIRASGLRNLASRRREAGVVSAHWTGRADAYEVVIRELSAALAAPRPEPTPALREGDKMLREAVTVQSVNDVLDKAWGENEAALPEGRPPEPAAERVYTEQVLPHVLVCPGGTSKSKSSAWTTARSPNSWRTSARRSSSMKMNSVARRLTRRPAPRSSRWPRSCSPSPRGREVCDDFPRAERGGEDADPSSRIRALRRRATRVAERPARMEQTPVSDVSHGHGARREAVRLLSLRRAATKGAPVSGPSAEAA